MPKHHSSPQRSLLAFLVLSVGLAGCGDGSEDEGDGAAGSDETMGADGADDGDGDGNDAPGDDAPGDDAPGDDTPGDDSPADDSPGDDDPDDDGTGDDGVDPPPGIPCEQPFMYEGREGCQTEVGAVQVKFFPLAEEVPVQRLVVFLHGDGGDGWTDNWGFRPEILDWADPQDFLVVGVRSPASYDGDTAPSFGAAQPEHADMVATALESFVEAYAVVEERTLYWGVSGGSWFTTSSYIPVAGHRVPGIFVANCGGSGVSFGWAWDPASDAATVALNSLYVNYGDQDFLAEPSAESFAEYTGLGFTTGQLVHPGATHCNHPIAGPTIEFWAGEL